MWNHIDSDQQCFVPLPQPSPYVPSDISYHQFVAFHSGPVTPVFLFSINVLKSRLRATSDPHAQPRYRPSITKLDLGFVPQYSHTMVQIFEILSCASSDVNRLFLLRAADIDRWYIALY